MAKCNICTSKISLVDQVISKCKCGNTHCAKHRLPELHSCKNMGEFKSAGRNILAKLLVKVEAEKLIKI